MIIQYCRGINKINMEWPFKTNSSVASIESSVNHCFGIKNQKKFNELIDNAYVLFKLSMMFLLNSIMIDNLIKLIYQFHIKSILMPKSICCYQ